MANTVGKSGQYWSGFSPVNIPGLALWYDFSDTSTIDLSGNFQVIRVRDKSGMGRHGTPSNGVDGYWVYDAPTRGVGRVPDTTIVQLKLDVSLNASANFFSAGIAMSSGGTGTTYILSPVEDGGSMFRWNSNTYAAGTVWQESLGMSNTGDQFAMSVGTFTGGPMMRVGTNGTVRGNNLTSNTVPLVKDGIELAIGTYSGLLRNRGTIHELFVFSNVISESDRAALENYLTNKWTIPDPPPTISAPTDISGCNLWLDVSGGTSNFTFVPGTSNILRWIDKSPMAYDVSTSSAPTYYPVWQDVSEYVSFVRLTTMRTNRPEPSNSQETGFIVGFRVINPSTTTLLGGTATVGTWRAVNVSSNIALRQANDVGNFTFTTDYALYNKSIPLEVSWVLGGKEAYTRLAGQFGGYRTSPNWTDTSGVGNTTIGPAGYFLREIILYDRALSWPEISNVSAYLTQKWNLSNYKTYTNGPVTNRSFASSQAFTRPFQVPYDIASCTLWLDAKDSNTLVLDANSNVLMWYDKSGCQNDVSAGLSRPVYSNDTIVFSNNSMTVRNSTVGVANNFRFDPPLRARYHTFIALHKPLTTTGNTGLIDFSFGYGSTNSRNVSFPTMDGTTPRGYVSSMTTSATRTVSTFLENSVTTEHNIVTASIQSNRFTIYRNGVVQRDVSSVVPGNDIFSANNAITSIGRWGFSNNTFYQGEVKEIFIFDRPLSQFAIAQVESYLAKKWNMTNLLPSNHLAFSNVFPLTTTITPSAMERIAIWVDATTYLNEYSNNATITTNWSNRATPSSAVVPTGSPLFLSNAWLGRPGVNMTSGAFTATFPTDASLSALAHQTFMVLSYNTGAPATDRNAMFLRATPTTNPKHNLLQIRSLDTSMGTQFNNAAGTLTGATNVSPPPVPAGSPFIYEVGASATTVGWTTNGRTFCNAGTPSLTATGYGWAGIGCDSGTNTTPTWSGNIHEIITFAIDPSNFTQQFRLQLRSYLARKWGLVGSLPTYPDKGLIV